ncbi:hypothetical protein McaMca56_004680 [Microsporum canis]
MAKNLRTGRGGGANPLDRDGYCLLSLDGGGIRGLSSLSILKNIMDRVNDERQNEGKDRVKPCEIFDLIGGTSTGGLIAIMLGRLEMDVDECIKAYRNLAKTVFSERARRFPVNRKGDTKAQYDSGRLRDAINEVLSERNVPPTELLDDGTKRGCHTFVCATDDYTKATVRLRSYKLLDQDKIPATICQAALATSAATTIFDPVLIDGRTFHDGAFGANNPVNEVEAEAINLWRSETADIKPEVKCFVSIGTGNPGVKPFENNAYGFLRKTLVQIATETENTERKFIDRWRMQYDSKRYFRFNVEQGLQDIGIDEYDRQGHIMSATDSYLTHWGGNSQIRDCVQNLGLKEKITVDGLGCSNMEREQFNKWLSVVPYETHHKTVGLFCKNSEDAKRTWLLENDKYRSWKDSAHSDILLLSGIIGSGKTYLMYSVVESLMASDFRVSYFYCSRKEAESSRGDPTCVFRTLLLQLSNLNRKECGPLLQIFRERRNQSQRSNTELLGLEIKECVEHIITIAKNTPKVALVIDALDELELKSPKSFLSALEDLGNCDHIKVVVSRRDDGESDMRYRIDRMEGINYEEISTTCDENRAEIKRFIDQQITNAIDDESLLYGEVEPPLKEEIIRRLNEKAKTMFLWVTLQVSILCTDNMRCEQDIYDQLDILPDDLEATFEYIHKVISKGPHSHKVVQNCLQWLLYSQRPLKCSEVIAAISGGDTKISGQRNRSLTDILLSWCCGLVTLVPLDDEEDNSHIRTTGYLQLIHTAVADYLISSEHAAYEVFWAHSVILQRCLDIYIRAAKEKTIEEDEILENYATQFWPIHVKSKDGDIKPKTNSDLKPKIKSDLEAITNSKLCRFFLDNDELPEKEVKVAPAFIGWTNYADTLSKELQPPYKYKLQNVIADPPTPLFLGCCFGILPRAEDLCFSRTLNGDWNQKNRCGISALCLAAIYGHLGTVKYLLKKGAKPEGMIKLGQRTPLLLAAAEGGKDSEEIIESLLENGANVNAMDGFKQTALHFVARNGFHTSAKALLKQRAMPSPAASDGSTPLSWAASNGHEDIVKLLLKYNVDPNCRDNAGRTPLSWAAGNGHQPVARLLLDDHRNVDQNCQDKDGGTPLSWAATNGHISIIELLLDHNVDLNCQNKDGSTPLSWAAINGHKAIVELLLKHNIDPNCQDNNGRISLLWAAGYGHESVVELLLRQKNIDINFQDKKGGTPLAWAAGNGHKSVVELLLRQKNINPNCQDKEGGTPISWAATNGHKSIVRLLLDQNIDPNCQDMHGGTPLSWAATNGHEPVVELLLRQKNINPNFQDKNGFTPLAWAARNGHKPVVELLLRQKNINPNIQDKNGIIPFAWAAGNGHKPVVELLLCRKNINPNFRDKEGRTPFVWAAGNGHKSVVELLLHQKNINPNFQDKKGGTPLAWAAGNGHKSVVELLLHQKNINPNCQDKEGGTPLSWAATNGHESIVRLLLLYPGIDINCRDNTRNTPLLRAARNGRESIVRLLLYQKNINPNCQNKKGGTPISWAAANGHKSIVRLLLDQNVDPNRQDKEGGTPISWAATNGHESIVRLLLDQNIDPNCRDNTGNTPLSRAAGNGYESVVKLLLDQNVNLNCRDDTGNTPLSRAAGNGYESVVKLLLDQNVNNLNCRDDTGNTPLSWAAGNGYESVVKLLLDQNVDLNCGTPLLWAAKKGFQTIVERLLASNADPNYPGGKGSTPLSWAATNGHESIVRLLLLHPDIDPNCRDNTRNTPLLRAAGNGRESIVRLLLSHPDIDINCRDNTGNTPLSWAIRKGYTTIVDLLRHYNS